MTAEIEKVTPARAGRASRPSTARKTAAEKAGPKVPAGARKPADHASAKTDVAPPKVIRIEWREDPETKEPFAYEFSPEAFDDLEYVDALISMETSKSQAEASTYAYIALKAILGDDFELYKEREKLTQGRATFSASLEFFNSMMEQMKKGNSGPSPAA